VQLSTQLPFTQIPVNAMTSAVTSKKPPGGSGSGQPAHPKLDPFIEIID
jgi:hypothetical protein